MTSAARNAEPRNSANSRRESGWRSSSAASSLSANSAGRPAAATSSATASASYSTRSIVTSTAVVAGPRIANAPRGSPSLGLPTEPQLTNSTPPCSRTHGLWVWPKTSTSGGLGAGEALVEAGGLVLEEVLVDLARRAVHEMDLGSPTSKRRSNGSSRMKSLERWSVCASVHVDRLLAELAVVRGDVRAAAVVVVARDRVVVVAVDRRDARARRSARRPRSDAARSRRGRRRSRRARCRARRCARARPRAQAGWRGCR